MSEYWRKVAKTVEAVFRIPDKMGKVRDFKLNNIQMDMASTCGVRDDILKFRQGGCSSWWMAAFDVICMNQFARCVLVAHNDESTRKLLQRNRFMLEHMKVQKPELTRENDYELLFRETGATFTIGTAGSKEVGRSDVITHLLCDEIAFWPRPQYLARGLFQAVPYDGTIIKLSTANGHGTWHHRHYYRARNKQSRYTAHFYPWYIFGEYRARTEAKAPYTEHEIDLKIKFKVDNFQLQWRREKISDDFEGDEESFAQEYPSTEEEAFLVSGGSMFENALVVSSDKWRTERYERGVLGKLDGHPKPSSHYSFGVDVAGGTGNDYSSVEGICLETFEQVLTYNTNHLKPPEFAKVVAPLGLAYNNAYLVPEANQHGLSFIPCVLELEPYHSNPQFIYRMVKHGTPKKDRGFTTSGQSKYPLIGLLQKFLSSLLIYDSGTIDQLRGFGETDLDKLGNLDPGDHDDRVVALALACLGLQKLQLLYPHIPEPKVVEPVPANVITFEDILSRLKNRSKSTDPIGEQLNPLRG